MSGRGNSHALDDAIVQATVRLVASMGITHFSVEAVAREVGCAKSSIYRRYGSRAGLVIGVAERMFSPTATVPSGGQLEDIARSRATPLRDPAAAAMLMTLMAEAASGTEIGQAAMTAVFLPARANARAILSRNPELGGLRTDADIDLVLDMLNGTVAFRAALGARLEPDLPARIADMLLNGVGGKPS